jgi:hypothetical protein
VTEELLPLREYQRSSVSKRTELKTCTAKTKKEGSVSIVPTRQYNQGFSIRSSTWLFMLPEPPELVDIAVNAESCGNQTSRGKGTGIAALLPWFPALPKKPNGARSHLQFMRLSFGQHGKKEQRTKDPLNNIIVASFFFCFL